MKINNKALLVISILAIASASLNAADTKKSAKDMKMDPAMQAKMAEAMKLGQPSQGHKALEPLAGNWNYTAKFKMTADSAPMESKGTSTSKWVHDGRFLQSEVAGDMQGMPFKGTAIQGYDNMKAVYQNTWIDNMNTGMMTATAQYDPATKAFTETGSYSCPMTGEKDRAFRGTTKIVDNDHYIYETFEKGPDGREFKGMEIHYHRSK